MKEDAMEEKIVFACIRISCSILFEFSMIFVDLCQSDFSESLLRIDLQKLDYIGNLENITCTLDTSFYLK